MLSSALSSQPCYGFFQWIDKKNCWDQKSTRVHPKRGKPIQRFESTMQSRYRQLHFDAALSRRYDYSEACHELQLLLRQVYLKSPKPVQLLMYNDVLTAFRLLAGLDTSDQLSAANQLVQAAETVLPRQRRSVAVTEYKQAVIAFLRRTKRHDSKEPVEFPVPADLLVHIFGFLDARSLVMASAVCRAWYEASTDDRLWRAQFIVLFLGQPSPGLEPSEMNLPGCWRKAFEIFRKGRPSRLFRSNRVYCMQCKSALWLSESQGVSQDRKGCSHRRIRALNVSQVVTYVRGRSWLSSSSSSSSSSSDTDSEEDLRPHRARFWAY